jgi:hypothetical protein
MMNVIMPKPYGNIDGNVIYISSKKSIYPDVIKKFTDKMLELLNGETRSRRRRETWTEEKLLKRILIKHVFSLEELIFAVHNAAVTVMNNQDKKVRM